MRARSSLLSPADVTELRRYLIKAAPLHGAAGPTSAAGLALGVLRDTPGRTSREFADHGSCSADSAGFRGTAWLLGFG